MDLAPCVLAAEREHYFALCLCLTLAVFLDFSKSSSLGAPGSDGFRICSLLPWAMRSFLAWMLAYRPVFVVVIWRLSSRFLNWYLGHCLSNHTSERECVVRTKRTTDGDGNLSRVFIHGVRGSHWVARGVNEGVETLVSKASRWVLAPVGLLRAQVCRGTRSSHRGGQGPKSKSRCGGPRAGRMGSSWWGKPLARSRRARPFRSKMVAT